ncbi:hypothetical protein ACFQ3W_13945 [Paenibacillus puldeungensis]|uniref:Post-SET domain-containing protein n=1 Tax=Paenibacillus puldeungensis TaxID=696536 RepID=A0ABW3RYS7_9BACL
MSQNDTPMPPEGISIQFNENEALIEWIEGHTVSVPLASDWGESPNALLQQLREQPDKLVALLEKGAEGISMLLPASPPWPAHGIEGARGRARCSCGEPACAEPARAIAYGAAAWAADAELRLRALGWTREALLSAVWGAWAAEAPLPDPEAALRHTAGPPEAEKRPAAPAGAVMAEWLAEAAEQGRLHQPGPEFHDVRVELRSAAAGSGPAPQGPDPGPWAALLPGVPGAAKGLALVAAQVMQRAEALAAALPRKPRRP